MTARRRGPVAFERKGEKLLPRGRFVRRLGRAFLLWCLLTSGGLGLGVAGYMATEGLAPLDAFLNAAMILSGMGPAGEVKTAAGKLFAGLYALFSGLFIVVATGLALAPLLHRMLHAFHAEADGDDHE